MKKLALISTAVLLVAFAVVLGVLRFYSTDTGTDPCRGIKINPSQWLVTMTLDVGETGTMTVDLPEGDFYERYNGAYLSIGHTSIVTQKTTFVMVPYVDSVVSPEDYVFEIMALNADQPYVWDGDGCVYNEVTLHTDIAQLEVSSPQYSTSYSDPYNEEATLCITAKHNLSGLARDLNGRKIEFEPFTDCEWEINGVPVESDEGRPKTCNKHALWKKWDSGILLVTAICGNMVGDKEINIVAGETENINLLVYEIPPDGILCVSDPGMSFWLAPNIPWRDFSEMVGRFEDGACIPFVESDPSRLDDVTITVNASCDGLLMVGTGDSHLTVEIDKNAVEASVPNYYCDITVSQGGDDMIMDTPVSHTDVF